MRVWDCNTAQHVLDLPMGPALIGALLMAHGHLFVGMHDPTPGAQQGIIRVMHLAGASQPGNDATAPFHDLAGPTGAVYAMENITDMLISAGVTVDKSLLVYKYNTAEGKFAPMTALQGHTADPVCLTSWGSYLFSGGFDGAVRMWNMENGQCERTLAPDVIGSHIAHTDAVVSLVCWEGCLLSASLDGRVKVWGADANNPGDPLALLHTQGGQERGNARSGGGSQPPNACVAMCGIEDVNGAPVVAVSHQKVDEVRLYGLPGFDKRGLLWSSTNRSRSLVTAIAPGSGGGIFFTGDAQGTVRVWAVA